MERVACRIRMRMRDDMLFVSIATCMQEYMKSGNEERN